MSIAPIVLDANLLVLLVVGTASRDYIPRHKRLKAYSADDFELLIQLLSRTPQILLTPNTLTETSNLIGWIDEPARSKIYHVLKTLIASSSEEYLESKSVTNRTEFVRLGLTDCALLDSKFKDAHLLTVDLDLYLAACVLGRNATNFNHLRAA